MEEEINQRLEYDCQTTLQALEVDYRVFEMKLAPWSWTFLQHISLEGANIVERGGWDFSISKDIEEE